MAPLPQPISRTSPCSSRPCSAHGRTTRPAKARHGALRHMTCAKRDISGMASVWLGPEGGVPRGAALADAVVVDQHDREPVLRPRARRKRLERDGVLVRQEGVRAIDL